MKIDVATKKLAIAEIFSSLQGEGPLMGEKHLFVRFPACNLHCEYCDEMGHPVVEKTAAELLAEIRRIERESGPHSFISLTGGEPLLYTQAIRELAVLKAEGFRFYLETSGFLVRELLSVLPLVDVVAMDIKLPSVTKDRDCFAEHAEFLRISREKEVFVKIVISRDADRSEFRRAVDLIAAVDPSILLVLQPMTSPSEKQIDRALLSLLNELQAEACAKLQNVRILPRLHVIWSIK